MNQSVIENWNGLIKFYTNINKEIKEFQQFNLRKIFKSYMKENRI